MTAGKRIVINAMATYGRTLLRMALGLFSSRWVLQSLGEVDYGLMGVVGSVIVLITFLNDVAAGSCSRFFAYSIGKNDVEDLRRWFNVGLSVHILLPAILIAIGAPIGEWAIDNFFNIPVDRLNTAHWVFRFSLVAAFWSMSSTPYMAMYTATQNIAEKTLWDVAQTVVNFGFVYWLTTYTGDSWLIYSAFTVGITVALGLGQVIRARLAFPGCRICFRYWTDFGRLRQMLNYSAWTLFGSLGYLARSQLPAILLNKYFPPAKYKCVNASYQIGGTVAGYTQCISGSLMGAFSPQITTLEGAGDRDGMIRTAFRASKFGTFLTLIFALPLLLEVDYLLEIWLKTPPFLAGIFCRLVLLQMVLDNLTFGHMSAILAGGKIKWYQITTGSLCMLSVPVAWLVLELGGGVTSVSWVIAGCVGLCSFARLIFGEAIFGMSIISWAKSVLIPVLIMSAAAILVGMCIVCVITDQSFVRLVITTGAMSVVMLTGSWLVLLDSAERGLVVQLLNKVRRK